MNGRLAEGIALVRNWWGQRLPREQSVVGAGAVLAVLVIAYWLLWQPAANGISRLEAELPPLRAQEGEMQAMALQAKTLRAGTTRLVRLAPEERRAAVLRSLERAGLAVASGAGVDARSAAADRKAGASIGGMVSSTAEVVMQSEARARIYLPDVDYGVWAQWLAGAESELGASSARVNVAALRPPAAAGRVSAEVLLDFPGSNRQ